MISHQRGSYSTRTVFNTVHILYYYCSLYKFGPFRKTVFQPATPPVVKEPNAASLSLASRDRYDEDLDIARESPFGF